MKDWIKVAQKELRKDNNFKQLVSKFGLIEDDYATEMLGTLAIF